MIELRLSPCRLQADGHAGQNVFGRDLVCAAVSVLVMTLVRQLLSLELCGQVRDVQFQVVPGHAGICSRDSSAARQAFSFAETGLRALANDYPDYITIVPERPKKKEMFRKGQK